MKQQQPLGLGGKLKGSNFVSQIATPTLSMLLLFAFPFAEKHKLSTENLGIIREYNGRQGTNNSLTTDR